MTTPEAARIRAVLDELHVGVFPPAPYLNGTEIAERIAAALTPLAPEVPPRGDELREALARAIEGGYAAESIDPGLYRDDPVYHAIVFELRGHRLAATRTPEPPDSGDGLSNHAETSAWQRPVSWAEAEADPAVRVVLREGLADLEAGRVRPLPPDSGDGAEDCGYGCPWTREGHEKGMADHPWEPAEPRDAGIDAALLAKAVRWVLGDTDASVVYDEARWREYGERIAAEYASLRSGSPAPEGGE